MLARALLAHRPEGRNLILITDGEPTSHFTYSGDVYFNYPPVAAHRDHTRRSSGCRRGGIRTTFVRVNPTTFVLKFANELVSAVGGRLLVSVPDELTKHVVQDFADWRVRRETGFTS